MAELLPRAATCSTVVTPAGKAIAAGVPSVAALKVFVPLPSCPLSFAPHVYTVPFAYTIA